MQAGGGKKNTSTAAGPAAGYFFQLRYGLYRALDLHRTEPTGWISIETIDDVTFVREGLQFDYQLKHSVDATSVLSKSSPGLWRTFSIWLDRLSGGLAEEHEFHLATTMQVPHDDPLSKLVPDVEEELLDLVRVELELAASTSMNAASKKDRERFLACSLGDRQALLRRIKVIPDAPNIQSISAEIEQLIYYACEPSQVSDLRVDLEGWWFNRIMESWVTDSGANVSLEEVGAYVRYLGDKYKPSTLPLDVPEEDCGELMEGRPFIRQIRLVTDSDRRLKNAQKAFLRSSIQRSKWVREHRIAPAELDEFDHRLCEQWEAEHARATDGLSSTCSAEEAKKVGRDVLGWAETRQVPIRSTSSTYLTSGSYHALADILRVGWHPHFADLAADGNEHES